MSTAEELVYARGVLSVDEIRSEIAQYWQMLDNPGSSALETELSEAGLDRAELAGVDRDTAIVVHPGSSGADPDTVLLLVALAPSANRMITDLWKKILLPRIQKRWGEDAIGKEKKQGED